MAVAIIHFFVLFPSLNLMYLNILGILLEVPLLS